MKIQNDVVDNDDDEIYGRIFFFLFIWLLAGSL